MRKLTGKWTPKEDIRSILSSNLMKEIDFEIANEVALGYAEENMLGNLGNLGLDVTVKTAFILESLKKNREAHIVIVEEAKEGYLANAEKVLKEALKEVRKGKQEPVNVHMQLPEDYTKEYDKTIHMFENIQEEELELSASQYDMLVNDNWRWKQQFLTSNMYYSDSAMRSM